MSKKTRIAKGLGASALAVATIASGLSFGSVAQAAPAPSADKTVKLILQTGPSRWTLVNHGTWPSGTGLATNPVDNLSTWSSSDWKVRTLGSGAFELYPESRPDSCIGMTGGGTFREGLFTDGTPFVRCGTANTELRMVNGGLFNPASQKYIGNSGNPYYDRLDASETPVTGWVGLPSDIGLAELSATGEFAADPGERASVRGTAAPGAAIVVKNGSTVIASTTAGDDGSYSVLIPAPNKGGELALTVSQSLDGASSAPKSVALDYGKGIEIANPSDQGEASGATAITGTGQPGASVKVFDNAGTTPIVTTTVRADGTWTGAANLSDREHVLEAKQASFGANTTTATVTVNPGENGLPSPSAKVEFGAKVTDKATIAGTAETGATITVRDANNAVIGTPQVVDGKFSLPITSPGAGQHDFFVTQSAGGETSEPTKVTGDFGTAVAVTALPAQSTPGDVPVSGAGQDGATVTVKLGSQTKTVTVEGGRWSTTLELAPSNTAANISVSQTAQGNTVTTTTATTTPNASIAQAPVTIDQPSSQAYTPMVNTTLSGSATPYAQVKVETKLGGQIRTVTADKAGKWSFDRVYGPSAVYTLIATQTRVDGSTSKSAEFVMNPVGAFRPLALTTHADGRYVPGENLFSGTATPDATITAKNQWGAVLFTTKASAVSGAWQTKRNLGPSATYEMTITQVAPDGQKDQVSKTLRPVEAAYVPAALTSPTNNSTYRPGNVTFTGTGTTGTQIVAKNQWGNQMGVATVGADGKWSFDRNLGPSADYQITFTAKRGADTNTFTVNVNAPKSAPLVITSPEVGATYEPGKNVTFTGTAIPFATIDVQTKLGTKVATTTADANGQWRFTRAYGPTNVYQLVFTQSDASGAQHPTVEFTFGPNVTK